MPVKRSLTVHIMGGTIDSRNDPLVDGAVTALSTSLVKRYLSSMDMNCDRRFNNICIKDSRSITQEDRSNLLRAITEYAMQHHLVTHGTYTINDTAVFLATQLSLEGKIVVLTGSMGTLLETIDKYGHLMPSDAQFNLGYSIAELFHLEKGVYICMNGEAFCYPKETWMHTPNRVHWKK